MKVVSAVKIARNRSIRSMEGLTMSWSGIAILRFYRMRLTPSAHTAPIICGELCGRACYSNLSWVLNQFVIGIVGLYLHQVASSNGQELLRICLLYTKSGLEEITINRPECQRENECIFIKDRGRERTSQPLPHEKARVRT